MKIVDILSFSDVYQAIKDEKMPIALAYKFSKLARRIEEEDSFYREKLRSIIERYSEKDENGKIITTDNGNGVKLVSGTEEACTNDVKELQSVEIDIPISFDIKELECLTLTVEQTRALLPFIRDLS